MRLELDSAATIRSGEANGAAATGASGLNSRQGGVEGATRDTAQVSGVSSLLHSLSTDRGARIQQLATAVGNGSYDVPSAAISHALIGETQAARSAG